MKKAKGILGCIMAFVYVLIIQVAIVAIVSVIYGIFKLTALTAQGVPKEEIRKFAEIMFNQPSFTLVARSIASMVTLGVYVLWYYLRLANKQRPTIKKALEGKTMLWIGLLAIGSQLGTILIMQGLMPLFPNTFANYEAHMGQFELGMSLISFIAVVFIAPISEEFIFRAVILNKGRKVLPFMAANILQSLLFAIIHANIVQGIYAFFFGLLLGMVYEKRKSIIVPILLHMGVNLAGVIISTIPDSFLEGYEYGGVMMLILAVVISVPALIIGFKKISENPILIEEETPMEIEGELQI